MTSGTAKTLLYNGDIWTLDGARRRVEAIGLQAGRVCATGTVAEVTEVIGKGPAAIDLGGRAVLPGFLDIHHHASVACLYGGRLRLAPPEVTDLAGLLARLRDAAAQLPPGAWLVAVDWNESLLAERRAPTRAELDAAVPEHPVFALHYSCHRAVANSRALALAGIDRHTAAPPGGVIERSDRGEPTGVLVERGMSRVESLARASLVVRDREGFFARLGAHYQAVAALGITHLVDTAVPPDLERLYHEARDRGLIRVPTTMMPVSLAGWLEPPVDALDGAPTGTGDALLSRGPVKLVLDGAPGCAMCMGVWQSALVMLRSLVLSARRGTLDPLQIALSLKPQVDLRTLRIRTGLRMYAPGEAAQVVARAVERGFSVATHAIGNEAVAIALDAYAQAGTRLGRAGVPRIEHGTFLDADLIGRMAGLGVGVVTQPDFLRLPQFAHAASIPGIGNTPLRDLLDRGVQVASSSDFPVAGFDPLDGIRSAVTRRTSLGEPLEPAQRITLAEAVALYTRSAAQVAGCLGEKGSLEPGKRADLIVLDRALDESSLDRVRVAATLLGGELIAGQLPVAAPA